VELEVSMRCQAKLVPLAVSVIAILIVLSSSRPAYAGTLFSQPYVGFPQGWVSDLQFGQYVADDFTLLSDSVLTDFHWWGGYTNTLTEAAVPNDDWYLLIFPDLASLQGLSNYTEVSLTNLSRTDTGDTTTLGNAILAYGADFVSPLTLSAGTYYALLVGDGVPGDDSTPQWAAWNIAGATTGSGVWVYYNLTWTQLENDQAFEVTGTPVPEPATLLLLGTGLAAAGVRRRMKKRS
jgi:hypothetical protein